jgi:hypothetical protein
MSENTEKELPDEDEELNTDDVEEEDEVEDLGETDSDEPEQLELPLPASKKETR